jgi:hypothetical protein
MTVKADTSVSDVQKVVREENKKTVDDVSKKVDDATKALEQKTIDFANRVMADFVKIIEDTEKKIILLASITIVGLIGMVEGIIGFIRIKKEQNLLLLLKNDINVLNSNFVIVVNSLKTISASLSDIQSTNIKNKENKY